ncbi:MAG: hypothetical protein QCI00_07515 [Candidatus Thermoplasmatota archaeon]|nr:hypothetical protein [Candidatus Thermoplasmatota archaeon]
MKTILILVLLSVACLVFAGCVEEQSPSNNDEGNDDSGNTTENTTGDDEEDEAEDDQTVTAGWYLKEVMDYGDKVNSTHDYYSYDIIYERENVTTVIYGGDGQEVRVRTTYDTPPEYIEAEGLISIYVKKEGLVVNHGGLGLDDTTSITIDFPELELGYGSSSLYRLSNVTYGEFFKLGYPDEPGTMKEGVFTASAPIANGFNGNFSLTFSFKNGAIYGTEYVYEWRE